MGTFFRAKIDCCAPPAAAEFRLRGYKIIIRKQVAPLDFQKFLPEYLVNQKWATHNMLRPSSVAVRRHQAAEAAFGRQLGEKSPPGGRLYHRQLENKLRPSSPPLRGRASPQGEALEQG